MRAFDGSSRVGRLRRRANSRLIIRRRRAAAGAETSAVFNPAAALVADHISLLLCHSEADDLFLCIRAQVISCAILCLRAARQSSWCGLGRLCIDYEVINACRLGKRLIIVGAVLYLLRIRYYSTFRSPLVLITRVCRFYFCDSLPCSIHPVRVWIG